MGLFKKLFGKKSKFFCILNISGKFDLESRISLFEERFDTILKKAKLGCVSGGGSFLNAETYEPENCGIELCFNVDPATIKDNLVEMFTAFGLPKGSELVFDDETINVGTLEGMALHLNGTELSDEIYSSTSALVVAEELSKIFGDDFRYYTSWQGATETAIYFYGISFEKMKELSKDFVNSYPLCQKCKITNIFT